MPFRRICLISLSALLLLQTGCFFKVDREFVSLRNELLPPGQVSYEKEFQHQIGRGILGLAARFVDTSEDPEAALFLRAVHRVQLGVYRLHPESGPAPFPDTARHLDQRLLQRGFYPVVRVREENQLVAIYAPDANTTTLRKLRIMILKPEQAVILFLDGRLDELSPALVRGEVNACAPASGIGGFSPL